MPWEEGCCGIQCQCSPWGFFLLEAWKERLFLGCYCRHSQVLCISLCLHCMLLPCWLAHAIFSLWQPSCPYRQHKLGEAAGINNFSCTSTAAGAAQGLPARWTRALSTPYAAIWFCWRFWSLSRVWFMWQEQRHSHWRSRAWWLALPLLKGEVGSHQGWVLGCPLLDTSGEGKALSLPLAHSGWVWARQRETPLHFYASCLGLRECRLPCQSLGKRYWRVFLRYKKI